MLADVSSSRQVGAICAPTSAAAAALARGLRRRGLGVQVIVGGRERRTADPARIRIDLTSPDAVDGALRKVANEEGKFDYLVVVTDAEPSGPFLGVTLAQWEDAIATNLTGVFLACRTASKLMAPQRFGRIIIVSSLLGRTGAKFFTAATAAQAGILGLARTLALEVATQGITVNVVSGPAPDPGRRAQPQLATRLRANHLVAACQLLLSDQAAFITGQELRLDAGWSLW